jgi:hypothetical protein
MNKMLFQLLLSLALFLFVSSFTAEAQNKKRTAGKTPSPTVVADKPGVYVTFERFGKRTPLRDDEGGEGVWLRLNNNMRYSISVCYFSILEEGEQLNTLSKNAQTGVKYDVVLNSVAITDERPNIDVPIGYNTGDTCTVFKLKSGKSLVFAVPAEHLVKGLSIKIPFIYEWEEESEDNPTHFVYFNSASIPKK